MLIIFLLVHINYLFNNWFKWNGVNIAKTFWGTVLVFLYTVYSIIYTCTAENDREDHPALVFLKLSEWSINATQSFSRMSWFSLFLGQSSSSSLSYISLVWAVIVLMCFAVNNKRHLERECVKWIWFVSGQMFYSELYRARYASAHHLDLMLKALFCCKLFIRIAIIEMV